MWDSIYNFFDTLWGYPMLILLVGGGLYYGIRTGFFQIRCLPLIFRKTFGEMFKKEENDDLEGSITPFQALSTVLAGTVGSGNIAGVATAIAVGGPGALFWMWMTAIFGMMTKLAEVSLTIKYRKKGEDGEWYGGPMHYIRNGLGHKWGWLAGIYAVALMLLVLTDAAFVQVNTAATALDDAFGVPLIFTGVAIALVSLVVVLGGIKRIGKFCSVIVPPMCALYIIGCIVVILLNIGNLGHAFGQVFGYAFRPMSAVGGFAGSTVLLTMTKGGFRGIFSNEAGEGTAATVHATAKTDHPIHQGFYGVVEVFIDTIVICTLTGISILCVSGDVWTQTGADGEQLTGIYLTFAAFRDALGPVGVGILGIAVFLFAYSSYLGFFVEFRTSLEYVFGEKAVKYLKWLFFIPPVISCTLPVSQIWDLADMVVGFIFIPNMIAILLLSPQVLEMLKEYTAKCRAEEAEKKKAA
ncbi:MAG: sodium:alanine symporter family protein [Clostridiales bacterium]|nr:sodium:alanine symporter family protein [Clostridiales bacterium]